MSTFTCWRRYQVCLFTCWPGVCIYLLNKRPGVCVYVLTRPVDQVCIYLLKKRPGMSIYLLTRYVYVPVERCCVFRRQTRGSLMSRQASSHIPPTAGHCTLAYDSLSHHWQSADTQHGDGFSHWGGLQCDIYQTSVYDRHTQTACHDSAISVLGFQLKYSFSINFPVFTARCTLVQSAVLPSHVVCLSVCNVGELWSHRLEFFRNNFTVS